MDKGFSASCGTSENGATRKDAPFSRPYLLCGDVKLSNWLTGGLPAFGRKSTCSTVTFSDPLA